MQPIYKLAIAFVMSQKSVYLSLKTLLFVAFNKSI